MQNKTVKAQMKSIAKLRGLACASSMLSAEVPGRRKLFGDAAMALCRGMEIGATADQATVGA